MNQYRISTKIFVEDVDLANGKGLGYLREIPLFKSVTTSVSGSMSKSASIQLYNPMELLTRSKRGPAVNGLPADGDMEFLSGYTKALMRKFAKKVSPLNPKVRDLYESAMGEQSLLGSDFVLGADSVPSSVSTTVEGGVNLCLLQRVWIVTYSSWSEGSTGGAAKKRNSVFAGIITSVQEAYSSTGELTLVLTVSGLSRLMELVHIYDNFRLAQYTGTVLEERSVALNKLLYAEGGLTVAFDILANMKCTAFAAFPAYLVNYFMSAVGYAASLPYGTSNYYGGPEEAGVPSGWRDYAKKFPFFFIEPIWSFPANTSFPGILAGEAGPVSSLGAPSDRAISILLGESIGIVRVSEMLPKVWVDPLLIHIWNNQAALSFTQTKIRSEWSISDTASKTAKDIFMSAAKFLFANAYEDDFGNLRVEVPKYWMVPSIDGTQYKTPQCLVKQYRDDIAAGVPLGDDELNSDYILTDDVVMDSTKVTSEANILTHVEVPTQFALECDPSEYIRGQDMTGRVKADSEDILSLQQRYGLRIESVDPLWMNKVDLGASAKDGHAKYKESIDSFAKAILVLRNLSCTSESLTTVALHWLQVNKTVFLFMDEALYHIVQKSFTYSVDAPPSFNLTLSARRRLNQVVGYPFYDFIRNYMNPGTAPVPTSGISGATQ